MNQVAVIGIGEDGLAGLRPEALAALQAAEVLAGGERHHRLVREHPAERIVFRTDPAHLAEDVAQLADRGRRVAVLASGDPGFFGIGPWLARRLGPGRVRIYPNLGSVALAFARLGEAWQDATVVSAQARPLPPVVEAALASRKLAVLLDDAHTAAALAQAFLAAGLEPDARTWVMERLGGPAERVRSGRLDEVPGWTCDPLSVLIVLRDSHHVRGPGPRFGLADDAYVHLRGQITKAEVRAFSLARMAARPGDTVWDVGAGSGAVSVEAAAFCRPGMVYAIERRAEQCVCVRENLARFGVSNVQLVEGVAPDALAELPDPDAVFVGGSGGLLSEILDVAARQLRPGGRLVANLVTLESLEVARTCLARAGLSADLVQISVARASSIEGATRLAALNPVFVVSTQVVDR
ncbi:MAG TPA: precorrin-6y C5,15-methyltransferase (decarboxylating) subunit CbiE [Chloroflexota bacterium]|nr:precorrin-6y C5,15-methyltransferase (decarboxylating) subunit CbiE [Chloroflexota bacterium]